MKRLLLSLSWGILLLSGSFSISADESKKVSSKVISYVSDTGSEVSIVRYGQRKDKTYLVHFDKFDDPWDNNVILHHLNDATQNKKYEIRYKKGLGKRQYQTLVDSGKKTLRQGSLVPVISAYMTSKKDKEILVLSPVPRKTPGEILKRFQEQKFHVKF